MLYLKIINTFMKNNVYILYSKLSKKLKNIIRILVGLAVLELLIKTIFWLFWSTTEKLLGLLKIDAIFEFLGQFTIRSIYFFQKGVDNFEIEHKTC